MKFRAHDTFAIRKGWLHKGMRHVVNNPRIFVDKDINPMDEFGIGANMVKALRYWLQATGLTEENTGNNRNQYLSPFGEEVWANDPYLEEDGTLLLIHYFLASNEKMATAWYYFFNHYKVVDITEESFIAGIKSYLLNILKEGESLPSDRALTDDFDCIVKTYIPNTSSSPESNMGCPLSDLSLLATTEKSKYVKVNAKSNKDEIKDAFEAIFGVKVAKVNVINVRPRAKRLGRFEGQVSGYKKAIVKLAEGQSLDLYSEASE